MKQYFRFVNKITGKIIDAPVKRFTTPGRALAYIGKEFALEDYEATTQWKYKGIVER